MDSKMAVNIILSRIGSLTHTYNELEAFVNLKDRQQRTALSIATDKGHDEIIGILLRHYAKVTINFDSVTSRSTEKVILKVLDDDFHLETNQYHTNDSSQWKWWIRFT